MTDTVALDVFPASFAQQRLWFLDQLESGFSAYHMTALWRLQGPLDIEALQGALDQLLIRHESLRTSFQFHEGLLQQRIHPSISPALTRTFLPEASTQDRCLWEHRNRRFNLATGPLIRALLIEEADEVHFFQMTIHHIASDGWSASILYRELSALYDAFSSGRQLDLPPLPIQVADFSVWQQQLLSGLRRQQLERY